MPSPVLDYHRPTSTRPSYSWPYVKPFVLLALLLIPLEFAAAQLAYHTIGEVVSGMMLLAIFLNVVPLAFLVWSRSAAITALLIVALLFIPYQLHLGIRWWRVHSEADRLRAWVEAQTTTGAPPPNLTAYTFRDRGAAPFIRYTAGGPHYPGTYHLAYWVADSGTSHWWVPEQRFWMYYPD